MDSFITESIKETMNNLAGQLFALAIVMGIAYTVSYILLSIVKVPAEIKNFLSTMALLAALYFSFTKIFSL